MLKSSTDSGSGLKKRYSWAKLFKNCDQNPLEIPLRYFTAKVTGDAAFLKNNCITSSWFLKIWKTSFFKCFIH